jgi:hypothetical protein
VNFRTAIGCLLLASPALEAFPVQCNQERYYEGETISCVMTDLGKFTFQWSIFTKELKRETMKVSAIKTAPGYSFVAPFGLKQITPLSLKVEFESLDGTVMGTRKEFKLYPRDPSFYLKPEIVAHKRIAVDDPTGKLKQELDALKVPYDSVHMAEMPLKRYDLFILGRSSTTANTLVPANAAPVIQLDVATHLDEDPLTRWLLAQRIRAVFKSQNDAKDLTERQSN